MIKMDVLYTPNLVLTRDRDIHLPSIKLGGDRSIWILIRLILVIVPKMTGGRKRRMS
jgi:hypothetical protein